MKNLPGPLTLILKNKIVKGVITGGQETVGIRMPNHPVTLNIINKLGSAIVGLPQIITQDYPLLEYLTFLKV